jgi:hypothetical protein
MRSLAFFTAFSSDRSFSFSAASASGVCADGFFVGLFCVRVGILVGFVRVGRFWCFL